NGAGTDDKQKQQQQQVSSPPELERKLSGKDGDSCVLYPDSTSGSGYSGDSGGRERRTEGVVVRKLAYTAEPDTDHEKPMPAKVAEAQTRNDEAGVNKLGSVDQDGVGVINSGHDEGKVDVATSISYAHFPSDVDLVVAENALQELDLEVTQNTGLSKAMLIAIMLQEKKMPLLY
ncbi:hypothetical protein PoB_000000300, partial [Plakobranchus ocellatus]